MGDIEMQAGFGDDSIDINGNDPGRGRDSVIGDVGRAVSTEGGSMATPVKSRGRVWIEISSCCLRVHFRASIGVVDFPGFGHVLDVTPANGGSHVVGAIEVASEFSTTPSSGSQRTRSVRKWQ